MSVPQFWRRFARGAIPFGLWMALSYMVLYGNTAGWRNAVLIGLLGGVLSGILFGLALATFTALLAKRRAMPALDAHERIIKDGPASHFKGLEAVGGWLFLTDLRLVFKAHQFNLQRHEISVLLSDISEAQSVPTLWVIPNGLRIVAKDGHAERFVVEQRDEWTTAISSLLTRFTTR